MIGIHTPASRTERIREEIAELRAAGLTPEAWEAIKARHPEDMQAIAYGLCARRARTRSVSSTSPSEVTS